MFPLRFARSCTGPGAGAGRTSNRTVNYATTSITISTTTKHGNNQQKCSGAGWTAQACTSKQQRRIVNFDSNFTSLPTASLSSRSSLLPLTSNCSLPVSSFSSSSSTSCSPSASPSVDSSAHAPVVPRNITLLHTLDEVRAVRAQLRAQGQSLGFVPTMGALHEGHLDLVRRAKHQNHATLVSIFVNPTQFLAGEDYTTYPRPLDSDLRQLSQVGANYVFAPSVQTMYPDWPSQTVFVDIVGINDSCEGAVRPGHFKGVATVVTKLLNIVQPDRCYFGQKDGMQCIVLNRVVRELNLPTSIVICPTVRASDGLALSSRNVYLSPLERSVAPTVFRALQMAMQAYEDGQRNVTNLKQLVQTVLSNEQLMTIQYISIASSLSGQEIVDTISPQTVGSGGWAMLSVAVKLGKTRLIDNVLLGYNSAATTVA